VLFNDRYILKGRDLVGLDPISRTPVEGFSSEEVIDLTLLNIVKKRELVSRLKIFEDYLPEAAGTLSAFKRKHPEKSIRTWSVEERQLFFQAAAILVENIKSLNPGLDYDDIVSPRREIVVPTSPYHVSLSYDKLKTFYDKGDLVVFRGETTLSEDTIRSLEQVYTRSLMEFASFIELLGRTDQQHRDFRAILELQRSTLFPTAESAQELTYGDLFRDLDRRGLDFIGVATFLTTRLQSAVSDGGVPLGVLEDDLEAFKNRTVTLDELGDRLQTLDDRWEFLNNSPLRPVRGL
jgi:hypothetical protein